MKILSRFAACTLLAAVPALALAVQPSQATAPTPASAGATAIVERGGTIEAVDVKKKAIVVEGVTYQLPVGSVKIHWPANRVSGRLSELKAGMQIRFTSVNDSWARQTQVREIWVTSQPAKPRR
jgi:hypothetical protein